uniref:Basic salivary proline-rich protein 1-like n=1 Tax=Castor canadensis TaxID=51338 RepID=A0A8B7UZV7_CASCN|nr:basic salivary proline-rich protein 1-like [Castor canadensis]
MYLSADSPTKPERPETFPTFSKIVPHFPLRNQALSISPGLTPNPTTSRTPAELGGYSLRPPLPLPSRRPGGAAESPCQRWAPGTRGGLVQERAPGPPLSSRSATLTLPPGRSSAPSPLPSNLPLPPPPAHWPHARRVTGGSAPIHSGLRILGPPHPPADRQPIRGKPSRGSPSPSRVSQWQRETGAPGEGGGELKGPASVGV